MIGVSYSRKDISAGPWLFVEVGRMLGICLRFDIPVMDSKYNKNVNDIRWSSTCDAVVNAVSFIGCQHGVTDAVVNFGGGIVCGYWSTVQAGAGSIFLIETNQ